MKGELFQHLWWKIIKFSSDVLTMRNYKYILEKHSDWLSYVSTGKLVVVVVPRSQSHTFWSLPKEKMYMGHDPILVT